MPTDSRHAVDEIIGTIQSAGLDEATSLCRTRLGETPDDVNLVALLGALLARSGSFDEAERHLRRAIEIEPDFAKPHEDLGLLFIERGEPQLAVTQLEQAVALAGPQTSTLRALAMALQRAGRSEDALKLHRRYSSAFPLTNLLAQADQLREAGDHQAAARLCSNVLEREPGNVSALRLQAVIASDAGQKSVAENLLRRIVGIATDKEAAVRDLAGFLAESGRYPEAIDVLEPLVAAGGADQASLQKLGDMLSIVGRSADALRAYEQCLEASPDAAGALLGRAQMLRIEKQSKDAVTAYRRCIKAHPEVGEAWWNLSTMAGQVASDQDVEQMQTMLAAAELAPDAAVAMRFALARAFESRADYDAAWQEYQTGNAAKRALIKYDPVETETQNRAIREVFDAAYFATARATTPTDVTPVFVLGMPRAGSTLIEQVLASHPAVTGCGELPYIIMLSSMTAANRSDGLHYPAVMQQLDDRQLTGLGRSYLHYTEPHRGSGGAYFTDKMPANFQQAGFIHAILPHARIIDARRDPLATCVANYRQLFASGKNQSYDLTELAEYYLQYESMMRHWDEVLPGMVLRVDYEDVVADLEAQVRRILAFCGLEFAQECLAFHRSDRPVNTASSEQVRQPIYQSGVDFHRHFDRHLEELRLLLAPLSR